MLEINFASINVLLLTIFLSVFPTNAATELSSENPWTIRCETVSSHQHDSCFMYQEILLKKDGLPVLQFSIGLAEAGQDPIVLITLPLGIYLPTGVSLMIDEQEKVNFPIERCDPDGCHMLVTLTDGRVDTLINARELKVFFNDSENSPIVISLSLFGFKEAFHKINPDFL